jgi:transcriptional regulator with XRE-family HTH domain
MAKQTLGQWLKDRRKERKISQEVAVAGIKKRLKDKGGFTKSYLSHLENDRPQGKTDAPPQPRKALVQAIAEFYNSTESEILTLSGWKLNENETGVESKDAPNNDETVKRLQKVARNYEELRFTPHKKMIEGQVRLIELQIEEFKQDELLQNAPENESQETNYPET